MTEDLVSGLAGARPSSRSSRSEHLDLAARRGQLLRVGPVLLSRLRDDHETYVEAGTQPLNEFEFAAATAAEGRPGEMRGEKQDAGSL
jgi:hypothetical protein